MLELRPDKNLLDKNFNGYKLSLDSIPHYRHELHNGIDQVFPSEDQFSFVHMKVFSLHNHLFADPWTENSVYFLDSSFKIHRANINKETGRLESVITVWDLPQETHRESGHYNACISFPSESLAIVTDGSGMLYIVERSQEKWKCDFSGTVVSDKTPFLIINSRLQKENTLHCILLHIETSQQNMESVGPSLNKPKASLASSVLHWITIYKEPESGWNIVSEKKIVGKGAVDYVALEPGCEHLYIASNASFKFVYDSINPIIEPLKDSSNQEQMETNSRKYTWKQTDEDILVVFPINSEITRNDLSIKVSELNINVTCKEEILLEGNLFHALDNDLTTWTINDQRLELTLMKRESGLMWQHFIEGNSDGEEIIDSEIVGEVHSRLSHLCSDKEVQETGEGCAPAFNLEQLEECDSLPGEMTVLSRLNINSHCATHQITLGGHQWIMSTVINPDAVPAFCIRHDVDACMWQLETPTDDSSWPCYHVGTFLAFGYVSASKQQRKFTLCSPDLSYAIICEEANHIFVYRKSSVITGDLRNRVTGSKIASVAKQQLIKLDSPSSIIGAYAANRFLFILTSDALYTFYMD